MIYIVRHGERADDTLSKVEKAKIIADYDPHLTELGVLQSEAAGKEILKFTEEVSQREKLNSKSLKYIVVSSPFLRCVQTAATIARTLGPEKVYNNKLYLEPGASEILMENWFKPTILDDLLVKKLNKEELPPLVGTDFTWGVEEGKSIIDPIYPEGAQTFFLRFQYFFKYIRDWFLDNFSGKDYALVIVTHGFAVKAALQTALKFSYSQGIEFTCITGFYYDCANRNRDKPLSFVTQYAEHIRNLTMPTPKL